MLRERAICNMVPYCAITSVVLYGGLILLIILNCFVVIASSSGDLSEEEAIRHQSQCTKYYYTETVSHPKKTCGSKVCLLCLSDIGMCMSVLSVRV